MKERNREEEKERMLFGPWVPNVGRIQNGSYIGRQCAK